MTNEAQRRPESTARIGFRSRIVPSLRRWLRSVYEKHANILCCADLNERIPNIVPRIAITTRIAGLADAKQLASIGAGTAESYGHRFERGEICTVAEVDDCVVAFVWITLGTHVDSYLHTTIDPGLDGVLGYDAYTHPKARGLRIRSLLFAEERRRGLEQGRKRLIFWLDRRVYHRAMRHWTREGFVSRPVRMITTRIFFGRFSLVRWTSLPKDILLNARISTCP